MNSKDFSEIFAPFADPETPFEITESGTSVRVQLTFYGQKHDYLINPDTEKVTARHQQDRPYANVRSLIASNNFADLAGIASNQKRILSKINILPPLSPEIEVDGKKTENEILKNNPDFLAYLDEHPVNQGEGVKVILLDGPAGVGKTHFITQHTLKRAERYGLERNIPLILHVTSRGRRLSNLKDILAGSLQMIRTRVTFEQVPVLVRLGLLQLAIDGFDELVDADGYQDAWCALRDVLEDIGTGGLCILSGRDTFFDQQGFLKRLKSFYSLRIDLTQVRLHPISQNTAKQWLIARGWPTAEVDSPATDDILYQDSYTLRPYFLTQIAELKGWKTFLDNSDSSAAKTHLRDFVILNFLKREAEILKTTLIDISSDNAYRCLKEFFEEISIDMAEREADFVDIEFMAFICEVVFHDVLSPADIKKLQHKVSSLALLERFSSDQKSRRFPHSEVQFYFLSHRIIKCILDREIPRVLRRGVFGTDFLEVFMDVFNGADANIAIEFIEKLYGLVNREISGDRLLNNGTSLLLSALTHDGSKEVISLENLEANEATFYKMSPKATLKNISVGRLDSRSAYLSNLSFENFNVAVLIVDELTKFGKTKPNVSEIQFSKHKEPLRKPSDINMWMQEHSTLDEENIEDAKHFELVKLFDRICRKSMRQYYIREDANDDPATAVLQHSLWPEIRNILEEQNYLESSFQQARKLVRVKSPQSLLNPPQDDEKAKKIRNRIIYRAKILSRATNSV